MVRSRERIKRSRKLLLVAVGLRTCNYGTRRTRSCWKRIRNREHNQHGVYPNLLESLKNHDAAAYRNYLRVTEEQVQEILAAISLHIKEEDTVFQQEFSPAEGLAVTLRFFSSGESFVSLSYLFRIGRSTISGIVNEVCKAIYSTLQLTFLRIPTETSKWLAIAEDFEILWNFPLCIGAVDRKHVVVESPALSGSDYHNYKNSFSVVLLAIVDAQYRFVYVDAGSNGRIGDSIIWRDSGMLKAILKLDHWTFLLHVSLVLRQHSPVLTFF